MSAASTAAGTSDSRAATVRRWITWVGAVLVATVAMFFVRASLDKAHVTLAYLLLVLGASASGGRVLGLTVAGLGFLCFDFVFLPPYGTFTISNPLDWLVLVAFLLASAVAAELLARATATAAAATQRAVEVDRLAALGAETLNAADADEALRAIAAVIRTSVAARECDIYLHDANGHASLVASDVAADGVGADTFPPSIARADSTSEHLLRPGGLVDWIAERGTSAVELGDGTIRVTHASAAGSHGMRPSTPDNPIRAALQLVTRGDDDSLGGRLRAHLHGEAGAATSNAEPSVRALALPLQVRGHTVGVLRIVSGGALALTPEQARLLTALAYYAALGAERARLVATAERAEAERRVERLRSALLTAVSHDLRTPLTTIKGIADEILRGAERERAAVIESEADRLDALVGDLLDLSRIHAGAVRPMLAVNTVDDLIGAALRRAQGRLAGRPVQIENPDDELLTGVFDFAQTLRILVNLLDNAAKYSPPEAPIAVRARHTGDRLTLDVMDRGPGIPESERSRIFDAFYRPPGLPPDIGGHGLGLSIARGLADAQGGAVRFTPRPGGGSVFTLELPAAPPPEPDPDESETGAVLDRG